jgi:hypothetical protein
MEATWKKKYFCPLRVENIFYRITSILGNGMSLLTNLMSSGSVVAKPPSIK